MYSAFSLCDFGLNDCDDNALCIDRDGGFDCQCITGYSGNGTHCDGIIITYNNDHAYTYIDTQGCAESHTCPKPVFVYVVGSIMLRE